MDLFVVDPCVGGDLETALSAGPVFSGVHQGAADALLAEGIVDEPAFDETDGVCGIASVGVGAEADLDEAGQGCVFVLRDEDRHGKSAVSAGAQDRFQFPAMLLRRGIGPEEMAHCGELLLIGELRLPNTHGHGVSPDLGGV